MECKILRPFLFSNDGLETQRAEVGETADIAAHLIDGLVKEKYIAPENKMGSGSPENKDQELTEARNAYKDKFNKAPFHGWDAAQLKAKIDEADGEKE